MSPLAVVALLFLILLALLVGFMGGVIYSVDHNVKEILK